jgi:hypothetical protein
VLTRGFLRIACTTCKLDRVLAFLASRAAYARRAEADGWRIRQRIW